MPGGEGGAGTAEGSGTGDWEREGDGEKGTGRVPNDWKSKAGVPERGTQDARQQSRQRLRRGALLAAGEKEKCKQIVNF